MENMEPKKMNRIKKIADIIDGGNISIAEFLVDLEEKIDSEIPGIQDLIERVKGDRGEDGNHGEDGNEGLQGEQGPIGPQGLPGKDGAKGEKGEQGIKGLDGKDGENGINGKDFTPNLDVLAVNIVNTIESFEGDDRIDYSSIKNELDNSITWDRFISVGQRLKQHGHSAYVFPSDDYEGLMCSFVELLESQNDKLFVNDTVRLNTKAAENALQLLVDLVNKYNISPKEITDYRETECYVHFVNHQDAFLRGWWGFYEWYDKNVKNEDVSNIYEKAPMPHFSGGTPVSIIGGWNLMMSKYSTKKSEVIEFIKYLLSDEVQKTLYEVGGYLPVKKNMYSDTTFMKKHPELIFYNKILKSGVHRPFSEKYTKCSDIIASYLNLAIQNKISVKEALGKAQRTINSGDVFIK